MAITSELIGKLGGGANIEEIPVTGTAPGRSTQLIHTVDNPDGRLQLVVVSGAVSPTSGSSSNSPQLLIGELAGAYIVSGANSALTLETTESVGISIVSRGSGDQSFTGTVYVVPLD